MRILRCWVYVWNSRRKSRITAQQLLFLRCKASSFTSERELANTGWYGSQAITIPPYMGKQCSPYQVVTGKIYRLKQQFLLPGTS